MEQLLKRICEMKTVVDILDGRPRDAFSTEKLNRISRQVAEVKLLLGKYEESLFEEKNRLEQDKLVLAQLVALDQRLDHVGKHIPKELLAGSPQPQHLQDHQDYPSSIMSTINGIEQSTISECTTSANPPPKIQVEKPKNGLVAKVQTNGIPTPEPRTDLEASISYVTNAEFDQVPQYMRGRLKLSDINGFIDVYNTVLNKKEALLKRSKVSLKSKQDLDLWAMWKKQKNDLSANYFCTMKDFASQGGLKLGKKETTMLVVLRHVKRIREVRQNGLIFYLACF